MLIPKKIHYCWFGGNEKPELANKCIESWKKYCPEYEIVEWNESNFDVHCCAYVEEAYSKKKWAFVSDYARFWILYHNGGVYFDTDVELIKPIDDIVQKGSFMGCEWLVEKNGKLTTGVATGLGLAFEANDGICKSILDDYENSLFIKKDGSLNTETVVARVTRILKRFGYEESDGIQKVDNIYIYPPEYFCPMNYSTGELSITCNTRSIHHYMASWHGDFEKKIEKIKRSYAERGMSGCASEKVQVLFLSFVYRIKSVGFAATLKALVKWIRKKVKARIEKKQAS